MKIPSINWEERRIVKKVRAVKAKIAPHYPIMNRFSVPLEALWSLVINFIIEVMSRHSVIKAWTYMTETPVVFLYNALMIFLTFTFVHLVRRRVFARIIVSVLWLFIGLVNGIMLMKRVTPFNAQDLKTFTEGLSLFTNYFSVPELVMMAVGMTALLVWGVAMFRFAGKYAGKMHRILAVIGVAATCCIYSFATEWAIDNRVISTLEILHLLMKTMVFHIVSAQAYLIQESHSQMVMTRKQLQKLPIMVN